MTQFTTLDAAIEQVIKEVNARTFDPAEGLLVQRPGIFFLVTCVLEENEEHIPPYNVEIELYVDEAGTQFPVTLNHQTGQTLRQLRQRSSLTYPGYPLSSQGLRLWLTGAYSNSVWTPVYSRPGCWTVRLPVKPQYTIYIGTAEAYTLAIAPK